MNGKVVLAMLLGSAALFAQQAAPTFRAGTTLVEFTVVALDGKGDPVTDLTREELALTEEGRTRDIAFFRFDGEMPPASSAVRSALPDGFVTNRLEQNHVIALALDLLNINTGDPLEKHDQTSVRGLLLAHLNTLPPNTLVGLFRFSEILPMTTLQTFTDRVDLIRSQINALGLATRRELSKPSTRRSRLGDASGAAAAAEAEARSLAIINQQLRDMRLAKTLAGLEALGNHLAGIPGRKSLVWISDGVPIRATENGSFDNYEAPIRQMAQRLANQGVALYPVVAAGLSPARRGNNAEMATFNVVAEVTGGRVVRDSNDLTLGVALAANDQRATYTIGFYAADEPNDEWHPLRLTVKRPGVILQHRQGYLGAHRAQPQNWPAKNWNEIANQALDSTGIRVNGRVEVSGDEAAVFLQIEALDLYFHEKDGQVIADLEIGLVEQTAKSSTRVRARPMTITITDPLKERQSRLVPLKTTWTLDAATTSVRAIVRDRFTGRYGTLTLSTERMPG